MNNIPSSFCSFFLPFCFETGGEKAAAGISPAAAFAQADLFSFVQVFTFLRDGRSARSP